MALAKAEELNIMKIEGGLHFAQLKGMENNLLMGFCKARFDVSKYL
jgi:hypothetical protein